jgi:hypothetical protein
MVLLYLLFSRLFPISPSGNTSRTHRGTNEHGHRRIPGWAETAAAIRGLRASGLTPDDLDVFPKNPSTCRAVC